MHSSQMNTDGPAMSFFTSCWLLPQKEQYRTFSPEAPFFSAMGVLTLEVPQSQRRIIIVHARSGAPPSK